MAEKRGELARVAPIDIEFAAIGRGIAGQLAAHSERAYLADMVGFKLWLEGRELTLASVTLDDLQEFRERLMTGYAPATTNRKLSVMRQVFEEAVARGIRQDNPAKRLRGLRGANYMATRGLCKQEAKQMLESISRDSLRGQRDYALLLLMISTGIRAAEVVCLRVGDFGQREGHQVVAVHGKGGKERLVKVPVGVYARVEGWWKWAEIWDLPDAPCFCKLGKGGGAVIAPLSTRALQFLVKRRALAAGVGDISPHSLRHSFVTLSLQGGAPLHKIQRACGHSDPRTTERYISDWDDLDSSAVDFIHLGLNGNGE